MFSTLWNNLLYYPVLNLLLVLYHTLGDNLGLAVIIIAVVVRLILIPSTKKQMEMTKKTREMQPKLKEIQKKFKNNQEQMAKEQVKLYKEMNYNPLGCLVSIIPQFVILMVIVQVIRVVTLDEFTGVYPFVESFLGTSASELSINTKFLFWDLSQNFKAIADAHGYLAPQGIAYLLLAVGVGIVQFFASKFMQSFQGTSAVSDNKKSGKKKDEPMSPEEMSAQMAKSMNFTLPLMTAFITLSTPAVLGIYWFIQSLMLIGQYSMISPEKAQGVFAKVVSRVRGDKSGDKAVLPQKTK